MARCWLILGPAEGPAEAQDGPSWAPKPALEGVWQVRSARAAQAVQDGAAAGPSWRPWTPPPAGTLNKAWVFEGSGQLCCKLTIQNACWVSWCASRRPEKMLSNGLSVFVTSELELKLAKRGLKASGGCNIGVVS